METTYYLHIKIKHKGVVRTHLHIETTEWLDIENVWDGFGFTDNVDDIDHMFEDLLKKHHYVCTCLKDNLEYVFEAIIKPAKTT